MVTIRLARAGAKKRPFYHIVVADQRRSRDGRYIERLGFFNPVAVGGEQPLKIDVERIEYWQGHGAQLSERVLNLVKHYRKHGELEAPKRAGPTMSKAKNVQPKKAEPPAAETAEPEPAEAEPAEPEAAEPEPAAAKTAEPEAPEAEPAGAESGDAESADADSSEAR